MDVSSRGLANSGSSRLWLKQRQEKDPSEIKGGLNSGVAKFLAFGLCFQSKFFEGRWFWELWEGFRKTAELAGFPQITSAATEAGRKQALEKEEDLFAFLTKNFLKEKQSNFDLLPNTKILSFNNEKFSSFIRKLQLSFNILKLV